MPKHKKSIRVNKELNCLEIDLTQGQVGLISKESRWVLEKYNFHAAWHKGKKDYYVQYADDKDNNKTKRLHQLLMDFPVYPKFQVDHINGNSRDNRLENMRIVSSNQNQRNAKIKNIHGMHGIHYEKKRDVFTAKILNNEGKQLLIGRSCKKHGKEQALELVKAWRKEKEKEFGDYL